MLYVYKDSDKSFSAIGGKWLFTSNRKFEWRMEGSLAGSARGVQPYLSLSLSTIDCAGHVHVASQSSSEWVTVSTQPEQLPISLPVNQKKIFTLPT